MFVSELVYQALLKFNPLTIDTALFFNALRQPFQSRSRTERENHFKYSFSNFFIALQKIS